MDDGMRHGLSARADLEGGDEFGDGIEGGPHPEVMGFVAQSGEEFVELKVAEEEVAEEVCMDLVGVFARAGKPEPDSDLRKCLQSGILGA